MLCCCRMLNFWWGLIEGSDVRVFFFFRLHLKKDGQVALWVHTTHFCCLVHHLLFAFGQRQVANFYVLHLSKYHPQKPYRQGFVLQWFVSHGCPELCWNICRSLFNTRLVNPSKFAGLTYLIIRQGRCDR